MLQALTDSNDNLVAVCRLVSGSRPTLDERTAVEELATEALAVLQEAAVCVRGASGHICTVGEPDLFEPLLGLLASTGEGESAIRRSESVCAGDGAVRWLGSTGAVMVVATAAGRRLSTGTLQLLDAVAGHGTHMLEVARLHAESLQQAQRMNELETAAAITAQVLPSTLPGCRTIQVAARCDPAAVASGDFYAVVEVDGAMVVAVGDVSGKGMPAAVLMAVLAVTVQATVKRMGARPAGELLAAINADVYDHLDRTGRFATVALAVWRPVSGVIEVANAGHSPVIVVRREAGAVGLCRVTHSVPPTSTPLGIGRELDVRTTRWTLSPGDALFMGSDGLAEQRDPFGRPFSYEALQTVLASGSWAGAESLLALVFGNVDAHRQDAPTDDDRTALVLVRRPPLRDEVSS